MVGEFSERSNSICLFIQYSSNSQQIFIGGAQCALGDLMVNQLDEIPFLRELWS